MKRCISIAKDSRDLFLGQFQSNYGKLRDKDRTHSPMILILKDTGFEQHVHTAFLFVQDLFHRLFLIIKNVFVIHVFQQALIKLVDSRVLRSENCKV